MCRGWVGVGEPGVELGGLTGRASKSLPAGPRGSPGEPETRPGWPPGPLPAHLRGGALGAEAQAENAPKPAATQGPRLKWEGAREAAWRRLSDPQRRSPPPSVFTSGFPSPHGRRRCWGPGHPSRPRGAPPPEQQEDPLPSWPESGARLCGGSWVPEGGRHGGSSGGSRVGRRDGRSACCDGQRALPPRPRQECAA